ncbi:MAG: glycosyl transferase family 2 [Gemmatimonadetes bacterium]|nr:glycosyl transferase family 2 [Gemmatimonadota bacterium]
MGTCVVVVNWNGWRDTVECLESLFRLSTPDVRVVVCDNASADGSLERIQDWAEGRLAAWVAPGHPLRGHSVPPGPKPVAYARYGREAAERGGDGGAAPALVLVDVGSNHGFAAGANVGLRYALARLEHDRFWLLNNDTVVDADALDPLAREMERDPRVGMAGSTLLYYSNPSTVQALGGGTFNPWLALPRHLGALRSVADAPAPAEVSRRIDFVTAASMLVSRAFLEEVGLLCEDYFLYFEEVDWVARAAGRYRVAFAPDSRVYHKEGGTVGTHAAQARKSWQADYYFARSRILFTLKHHPALLPTVGVAMLAAMLRRARRGHWDRVRMIAGLCWSARGGTRTLGSLRGPV